MFGFEFSDKCLHCTFPSYDHEAAVLPNKITRIAPLVWQEHCVECAMPACYGNCVRYQKRSDGRCRLFKHGIERVDNPKAILGQNAIIEMREWAKLETFFFNTSLSYKAVQRLNGFFVFLAKIAKLSNNGKIRRFCYYVKEYISRKIGRKATKNACVPKYLIFEVVNQGDLYSLALENHANNQVVYRTNLQVKPGYNRFLIPTNELRFQKDAKNALCIYSNENQENTLYIISLEMVDFEEEYEKSIVPQNNKKVKVVVWDLDHTLWDGILSEDGVNGIFPKAEIVKIVKELDQKGIINSIASKNDSDKALAALKHFDLEQFFVAPMINWNPKSQNIKAIAKNLDLGLDTFVFVDDTPNELQEVITNCGDVRVCHVNDIAAYANGEAFDVPITEESRKRRQMYMELSQRNQTALLYNDNIDAFLKDCKMIMHISHPVRDELERCFELLQRTNQLNISAERLPREHLDIILDSEKYECYRIKVDDKYGDYGLVGFAVFDVEDSQTVILKHFVFSCRAARKKLEQSFFEKILDIYKEKGYQYLRLICKKTEKNALMQSVLAECGLFRKENENDTGFELIAPTQLAYQKSNIVQIQMD